CALALMQGCASGGSDQASEVAALANRVELPIQIEDSVTYPVDRSRYPNVRFRTTLELYNGSKDAITSASFVVECVDRKTNKARFRSEPVFVDNMGSYRFRGSHALLPRSRPPMAPTIDFLMPSKYWTTNIRFVPKLVSDKILVEKNLTDFDQ